MMTHDEIAKALGIPRRTVTWIEAKALAKLRRNRALRELWEPYIEPRPLNGRDGNTWRRART